MRHEAEIRELLGHLQEAEVGAYARGDTLTAGAIAGWIELAKWHLGEPSTVDALVRQLRANQSANGHPPAN